MTMNFISTILLSYIMALLSMAFYTLLERKALAYFQLRKGPNKVSFMGLPQPFADAIKLFTKEQVSPSKSNLPPFMVAPMLGLILALLLWSIYPYYTPPYFVKLGALAFLCISSLNVYTTLIAGWSSNSKYALLGAIRSVAQTISYEVSMALILMTMLIVFASFNLSAIYFKAPLPMGLVLLPLFTCWFITMLAETNRTPFDLAEGESELVSGFNVEYSSGMFALIFMAEYTSILIMSIITVTFFLPMNLIMPQMEIMLKSFFFAFLFLWMRATLPRMRYDQLMNLTWKTFLPLSLAYLLATPPLLLLSS